MFAKEAIYNLLVRRKPIIKRRYEAYVERLNRTNSRNKLKTWLLLLRMDFRYYILRDKELSRFDGRQRNEPYCKGAESELVSCPSPEEMAEKLMKYDVISFDIFDTLIFRPFAKPADLFFIVGEKLEYPDFVSLRTQAEQLCRKENIKKGLSAEIDINDIYNRMEKYLGIPADTGIAAETQTELDLCYANPYMKRIFDILKDKDKPIIIVSDMYLCEEHICAILEKNGYTGYDRLYLSNKLKKSKYDGSVFELVKTDYSGKSIVHIGDNIGADVQTPKKHGIDSVHYMNVNHAGSGYRPTNMSDIICSAYSGIVNAHFHCGTGKYSLLYEYGYSCAGIMVLGYCRYIHKLAQEQGFDKILFLARDGDILKQVYDKMYPDSKTEYVYWSRFAAAKLGFEYYRGDFIRRFITHKKNCHITIEKIIRDTGVTQLLDKVTLPLGNELTDKNANQLAEEFYANSDIILEAYSDERVAARMYFEEILKGCKKALSVDVGWAGSGSIIMNYLVNKAYNIHCPIYAVIAGTNGMYSNESSISESFMQSGKMFSYCFSQRENYDNFAFHSAVSGHNIFFEMLLGSPSPQFKGFKLNNGRYEALFFDKDDENDKTVLEIHKGIKAFVSDYTTLFAKYPYMLDISGNDAYAPFKHMAQNDCRYLKIVLGEHSFDAMVGENNKRKINKQI